MARQQADREDLFAELRTCPCRVEWLGSESGEIVTAGIRRDGAASIYFGGEPCYHFDSHGRVRRALVDGALYRTQGTTLARLQRIRTPRETVLERVDLEPDELTEWLQQMQQRIARLLEGVRTGVVRPQRALPTVDEATARIGQALAAASAAPRLAPAIRTRP